MAADSANGISWFLSLAAGHKDHLGPVRHWSNLKIAFEGETIWVCGFTAEQIESVAVKTIPYHSVYYAEEGRLFPRGSLLPARAVPVLLWSPIGRGLPVELPPLNHYFFGLGDRVNIRLTPSAEARETFALITALDILGAYVETAPAVRLQGLTWVVLDEDRALILGGPLLPLPGEVCWRRDCFLLPAGRDFEFPVLEEALKRRLNPGDDHWVIWEAGGNWFRIPQRALRPLSIRSFRRTVKEKT